MKAEKFCVIEVTTRDKEEAERIAEELLNQRLVACVNIVQRITSLYWWQGKIEKESEALMLIKTKKERLNQVIEKIKELHSYNVPAIISFEIKQANSEYLDYINEEVK